MKKASLFAVVAIAALSMASCKKNYTCTCVTDYGGGNTHTTTSTINNTHSKASSACSAESNNNNGIQTTCTLN